MRIVQFITSMEKVGGAQVHVSDLSSRLQKDGHEVLLVTGGSSWKPESMLAEMIPVVYLSTVVRNINPVKDVSAFFELRKIIRQYKPDLIAAHSSKAGIIGRLVGWSLGIPTVFTAHGWSFTDGVSKRKRIFYLVLEKAVGFFTQGVITVSEYDSQLAVKHRVLPNRKLKTIHNGVHDVSEEIRATPAVKPPAIIMVARFAEPKNQLALLEAVEMLSDCEWNLLFVGEGPKQASAQAFAKEHHLLDKVTFLGARTDVAHLLASSHIFVLLSDWEGLPLSILEAMRSGLPIIASNVGGVKELVKDQVNGYLIEKNNKKELVNKLSYLLSANDLRRKMGEESRRMYVEKFTFEKMLSETVTYYQSLITEKQVEYPYRARGQG